MLSPPGIQLVACTMAPASPGFLVAGWRIIVQVGLALLYSIQDELGDMETFLGGNACASDWAQIRHQIACQSP